MPAYDLIDETWLNVRKRDQGGLAEVGLLDALLGSHEIEGLVVDLPTQVPALLRQVLLPVVVDALGAPSDRGEWGRRFAVGQFTDDEQRKIRNYLDLHRNRFDLFDAKAPFAQVAGLQIGRAHV